MMGETPDNIIKEFFFFGLGSSSVLLPPGDTSTSVADARGLLCHLLKNVTQHRQKV
jgi:hypothetical protein